MKISTKYIKYSIIIALLLIIGLSLTFISNSNIFQGKLTYKSQKTDPNVSIAPIRTIPKKLLPTNTKLFQELSRILNNPYTKILKKPSFQHIKENLYNTIIQKNDGTEKTAYFLVLELLNDDYNAFANNEFKQNFFHTRLSNYQFQRPAQKAYIISLVHSLWIENNGFLPWSLSEYSIQEIDALFCYENCEVQHLERTYETEGAFINPTLDLSEEVVYKFFLLAQKFLKENQLNTTKEIIGWLKKNFFHAYYDWGWNVYCTGTNRDVFMNYDGCNNNCCAPLTFEALFKERVIGCHKPTFLLTQFLRSLNIPAVPILYQGHGITYLPIIDRFIHGDHIADFTTVPVEDFFLTPEEMNQDNMAIYNILYQKYSYPKHYFTNIELHRENNSLFLETNSVCVSIPAEDWEILTAQVPEYGLQYDQANCQIFSNRVPIKTLPELSTYP